MTISIKYFITDSNGNFIDWYNRTGVALLDIVGKQAVVYGGAGADAVFVQAWTSADLTELGTNADRVYLTGNFADYSQVVDPDTGVYTFTRLGGVGVQAEVVKVVASDEDDVLYFADGQVSLNVLTNPALIGETGFQAIASVSGAGTPAEPAELGQPTTHTTPTKVFITDANGVAVPMAPQVGQALKIFGGGGDDAVYVRAGTQVDATEMGTGNDRVYLTGNLADYTQSIDQDTGVYTFSRTIHGATEEVKVTLADEDDVLYFADGHIVFNITRSDITLHDGNQFQSITALMLALPGTPPIILGGDNAQPPASVPWVVDVREGSIGALHLFRNTIDVGADNLEMQFTIDGQLTSNNGHDLPCGMSLSQNFILSLDARHPNYNYLKESENLDIVASYTLTDAMGGLVSQSVTFNLIGVNDAPLANAAYLLVDQSVRMGDEFEYSFNSQSFVDPDGDTLYYSASLYEGSPLPEWLSFDAESLTFSGSTPVGADATDWDIRVTAVDRTGEAGLSVDQNFNLVLVQLGAPLAKVDIIQSLVGGAGMPDVVSGNVLFNDIGEGALVVTGAQIFLHSIDNWAPVPAGSNSNRSPVLLEGSYGDLLLGSDGSFSYLLSGELGNALKVGQVENDIFRYRITDTSGQIAMSQLVVQVLGSNDAPFCFL